MAEHTVKSLGLARVMTGLGPRDFAYRGHGYSIEPGTNRYWRLRVLGGQQLATASTVGELLPQLAEILDTRNLDARADAEWQHTEGTNP